MNKSIFVVLFLVGSILPVPAMAQDVTGAPAAETPVVEATVAETQTTPPIVPQQQPPTPIDAAKIPVPQFSFPRHLLAEESDILSSPFRLKRSDAKWLLPLAGGAAALFAVDTKVTDAARNAEGLRAPSRFFSKIGGGAPLALASGSFFAIGKLTHNEKAADTGKLAAEALIHTQFAVQGLKMMFNRERPNKVNGTSGFWDGGRSFPSGHAATSFAFATVVAGRYNNKLAVFGLYGFATAISMSRIGGLNHSPSDVLIGAAVGHLIGRFILHRHPAEDSTH